MTKSYPNLVYPDSSNCPSSVAEAVWDIRTYKADERTRKSINDRYGTIEYFILAAEFVYEANNWPFTSLEKKLLRAAYRAPKPSKK
jgi:hypothetical protein